MEFSNLNTQYNQINADVIASITKENTNASKSNISSVYNSADLNLDAAVLSISSKGSAKMNAMLSKSIQLRANSSDPTLSVEDRRDVSNELRKLRKEIEAIRHEDRAAKPVPKKDEKVDKTNAKTVSQTTTAADTEEVIDVEKMMTESCENILKHADESIQSQNLNRERILQLL